MKTNMHVCLAILIAVTASSLKANAQWKLTGNAATNPNTNFLGTTDAKPLVLRTNNVERMRILQGGKVGIGTKTPSARLNVVSTDYVSLSTPGILMLGDVGGYNMALDFNVIQARYNGSAASLYLNYYGGYTFLGTYGTVAISSEGILTTGRTGINGNHNSAYALNVNANSSTNGINVTDGGNAYALNASKSGLLAGIYMVKTSTSSYDACVWGNSTGLATGVQGNSASGVGVYGITGNPGNYAGYFAGSVYTTGVYQASDQALKKDVKDFTKAMDIINQLRPKVYRFKDDGNYKLMNLPKGDRYGLIAEEVEKVLPGLVKQTKFETTTDADKLNGKQSAAVNFKALNYTELIPVLIKGMQEQQAVIDRQQQQIDELKQLIATVVASNASEAKTGEAINGAYLIQNMPNPFTESTIVKCYVPSSVKQAQLALYDMKGNAIKSYKLSGGMNNITINTAGLSSGQYTYALLVDGKKIDAKNMLITK